ncbi:TNF receptor-associated factor 4-like [Oopsacas minuta]|uniref:TNF receptor-associated factor 4-like n=1 Tax=Oopsacas minuta TaxID=111878 RepID=A0AAV7JER8_9METZ|nr:TNF receptor-associated factor 4-like [Oopsacas minuta]
MAEKRSQLDKIEDLIYITTAGTCFKRGGYKMELVIQNLSSLEESLVVCSVCEGIMHNTCSIKGGLAQVCESCVGKETNHQLVGSIRSMIAKISCKCALSERGCEWEGTLGGLVQHLEECDQFILQCPYIKYGCKKELKRGELENHRKEAKEYHTEVVSVFMADKVERLEEEKRQQTIKIEKLESALNEFIQIKDYLKVNGIIWTIKDRHAIVNKIYNLRGQPEIAIAGKVNPYTANYGGDANYSNWNGTNVQGPRFVVHSFYYLYPQLTIQKIPNADLVLQSYNIGECVQYVQWPLTGKCTLILINQINAEDSWTFTIDKFQITNNGYRSEITNIPFDILLDEKYNKDNTLILKILIDPVRPSL